MKFKLLYQNFKLFWFTPQVMYPIGMFMSVVGWCALAFYLIVTR